MKTIVINADPKRKGINARLMKSALKGAESVGAETQYVDLYKMKISGCRVCLICKNDDSVCKCYWRDELSPLIEDIFSCDCLLIGVPIFFSQPSSHYMALLERLIYSLVSYKSGNKFKGKVNVGLFYTINHPRGYFEKSIKPQLKQSEDLLEMLVVFRVLGASGIVSVCVPLLVCGYKTCEIHTGHIQTSLYCII